MKPEVHHLPPAKTWCERLHRNRFGLARHLVQVLVLLAFVGTARWGWTIAGEKLLSGDLSSSLVLGTIPLSDPLALLERLFAGHLPQGAALLGAVIVFVLYAVLGSRTFCGWVCPMNLVTDLADALRRALKLDADLVRLSKGVRYASLVTALLASAATGVAAFEAVSPQAFLWRDVVWGTGLGALSAALGIFALDLALLRHGWCGHLCPLGAFWTVVGKVVGRVFGRSLVGITFEKNRCTHCGDCLRVCPEPQIIRFKELEAKGRIPTGECLNCGKCLEVCPEDALRFTVRSNSQGDSHDS